jgi:hypothetical protein
MTNEPERQSRDLWKWATQGMLAELPADQSRYVSHMYDQAKVIEQAYGTFISLRKEGKAAEAAEFLADNREQLMKYRGVEHVKKMETKLNERIKLIERSAKSGDEKKALIAEVNKQKDQVARLIK